GPGKTHPPPRRPSTNYGPNAPTASNPKSSATSAIRMKSPPATLSPTSSAASERSNTEILAFRLGRLLVKQNTFHPPRKPIIPNHLPQKKNGRITTATRV